MPPTRFGTTTQQTRHSRDHREDSRNGVNVGKRTKTRITITMMIKPKDRLFPKGGVMSRTAPHVTDRTATPQHPRIAIHRRNITPGYRCTGVQRYLSRDSTGLALARNRDNVSPNLEPRLSGTPRVFKHSTRCRDLYSFSFSPLA